MREVTVAVFAGGCFWCTEAIFRELQGVLSVESGYIGGETVNPTYEEVCAGGTGHAEAIRIEYDPELISFETLLEVHFGTHDPTQLNRQGNDVGTQYRSAIFPQNDQQRELSALALVAVNRSGAWSEPVVTSIEDASAFCVAELAHQNYFGRMSDQPFCEIVIAPKLAKFRKIFKDLLKG
ncbi:MAG: peptide-methionine (S)-S-oxide reductase MsrA [Flavobacteriales bacterium]|nr:peptide-methionine (S)-S-oxide reductase MsrA [Flavobacteriales bacterium]